jgi:hypothetical protein
VVSKGSEGDLGTPEPTYGCSMVLSVEYYDDDSNQIGKRKEERERRKRERNIKLHDNGQL